MIASCKSIAHTVRKTCFSFPRPNQNNTDILNAWKRNINKQIDWNPSSHHRICDRHFELRFISVTGSGRKVLSRNAVPTLHLDHEDDDDTGND